MGVCVVCVWYVFACVVWCVFDWRVCGVMFVNVLCVGCVCVCVVCVSGGVVCVHAMVCMRGLCVVWFLFCVCVCYCVFVLWVWFGVVYVYVCVVCVLCVCACGVWVCVVCDYGMGCV